MHWALFLQWALQTVREKSQTLRNRPPSLDYSWDLDDFKIASPEDCPVGTGDSSGRTEPRLQQPPASSIRLFTGSSATYWTHLPRDCLDSHKYSSCFSRFQVFQELSFNNETLLMMKQLGPEKFSHSTLGVLPFLLIPALAECSKNSILLPADNISTFAIPASPSIPSSKA